MSRKQNLEVTVLLQAAEITRLTNLIAELEAKLRENSLRTKESRAHDLESEDSWKPNAHQEEKPNSHQEEFATVVSNYRQALTRNDELLEEIEMVRKSSIFIEAESKTLKKKVADLEATVGRLNKHIAEQAEQAQDAQQKLSQHTLRQKEAERQHAKTLDELHLRARQLKEETLEVYTQASIYREMYRVLKSVVCTQLAGLKAEEVDRLAQGLLLKYGVGDQLTASLEGLEAQQIAVLTRDVRRTFEMFFIEVTTLRETNFKTQYLDRALLTDRPEKVSPKSKDADSELLELRIRFRKLEQTNFQLSIEKDSAKHESEKCRADLKTLTGEVDRLKSQNRALNAAISVEENAAERIYFFDNQMK